RELSAPIAKLLGEDGRATFSLFPIAGREGSFALLYADSQSGALDRNALELLAAIAGLSRNAGEPAQSAWSPQLVTISSGSGSASATAEEDSALDLRARRFARVRVAQIRLEQSESVKKGRAAGDLYTSLKTAIDSGRQAFQEEFLSASPEMVDYLHREIL